MFYDILKGKKAFLGYKTRSSKSRKFKIFAKWLGHCFGPNWPFFHLFILGNIGKKNVFYDILEQKKRLLGYKNKKFKKSKN